jgi:hypothetical protein
MRSDCNFLDTLETDLGDDTRARLDQAAAAIVRAKEGGKKVAVVVGSGPNLHEGVTTLIAALIGKGIVDGVITSSAVICHEMGGALEKVHRVDVNNVSAVNVAASHDATLEASIMSGDQLDEMRAEIPFDEAYYRSLLAAPGKDIIKAAANLAYPLGLRTERLAREAQVLAVTSHVPLELIVGLGADPMTMIGAGAKRGVPVIVGVPQLIGGGAVGLAIGDCMTITERASRVAHVLASACVVIESAVALTQEIHDGPFETYTGHGLWAHWSGLWTYSLAEKEIIRIDLDPNLELAWQRERTDGVVSQAIANGLPKTKLLGVPFRMEMSGFSRLPGSLPLIADIGVIWPLLAARVTAALGVELDFLSYPQSTPRGQAMRDEIVQRVRPVSRTQMLAAARRLCQEGHPCT